ncbi:MAG: methionyl-tRNA formyltransferase [Clostridiales bacterium]|nr:methionyl-tRNA formyltransferase [Clostridiales bacterium]
MGTPDFALASLDKLIDGGYEIAAVVTQPDRPKGRGKKLTPPPVKERALGAGLRVLQPERVKDSGFIEALKELSPDIIIVVAYGQILPEEIINLPAMGCINVHASLLPKYRGAAPINWCIINGESRTGVTTMYMDKGMDTGDILLQRETEIGENETAGELHDRLAALGADLLLETLEGLQRNEVERKAQDHSAATYAPQLDRETGRVDWNSDAKSIYNLIRGTNPWPGCYTVYKGERMKLWEAKVLEQKSRGTAGKVLEAGHGGMLVQAGSGTLLVTKIQMPSSRVMTVDEYLRGNSLETGYILGE